MGTVQLVNFGSQNGGGSGTAYASFVHGAHYNSIYFSTESFVQIPFPTAGSISNLIVTVGTNFHGTNSSIVSRINAATGNLSATITASTTGTFQDTTHSDNFSAGDLLNVLWNNPYSITYIHQIGVDYNATGQYTTQIGAVTNQWVGVTNRTYYSGLDASSVQFIEANAQEKIYESGTLSHFYIGVQSNAATANSSPIVKKNGATANETLTITAGSTGLFQDTTHTDSLSSGDSYYFSWPNTTGGTIVGCGGASYQSSGFGSPWNDYCYNITGVGFTSAQYISVVGTWDSQTTSSPVQVIMTKTLSFSGARVFIIGNTCTGSSTMVFGKNGSNGNQSVSITATTTGGFQDTTHSDSVAANDTVYFKVTPTSGTLTPLFTNMLATYPIPPSSATFSASVSLANIGSSLAKRVVPFTAVGSLSAVGKSINNGIAAFSGNVSFSAIGKATVIGAGSLSSSAALSTIGKSSAKSIGNFLGSINFSGQTSAIKKSISTFSPANTFSGIGHAITNGVTNLLSIGVVSFAGAAVRKAVTVFSASSSLSGAGVTARRGVADFTPESSLIAEGHAIANSISNLIVNGSLISTGKSFADSKTIFLPKTIFINNGIALRKIVASFLSSMQGGFRGTGVKARTVAFAASVVAAFTGHKKSAGTASISASASLIATGVPGGVGAAGWHVTTEMIAVGTATARTAATWTATGDMSPTNAHRGALSIMAQVVFAAVGLARIPTPNPEIIKPARRARTITPQTRSTSLNPKSRNNVI